MDLISALTVVILGAMPFLEARYAIPLAILYGFPAPVAFFLGLLGNILVIIPLLLLLEPVSTWLSARSVVMRRFFGWLFQRTRRHDHHIRRYGSAALFLFVAVPIPVTGTWTGCAAAFVFGVPFKQAFPAIAAGAIVAALITTLPTVSLLDIFGGVS